MSDTEAPRPCPFCEGRGHSPTTVPIKVDVIRIDNDPNPHALLPPCACGGAACVFEVVHTDGASTFSVNCQDCYQGTTPFKEIEEAITAWYRNEIACGPVVVTVKEA